MKLSENQKKFADYFIETGNATQSYQRAGYKATGKSAEVNASRLLGNAKVREYIDSIVLKKDEERIAKQDEILEFLTSVLRGKVKEQFPLGMGMGEQSLVKKELDGKDRIKAAELLGKRYAMWTDKQQVDGSVGVVIVDDLGDVDDSPQG
ncbi:terminase small subunit [Paenibacillus polymyxa]|uniref:terminase small subunit n=1 Tax=Paenibacillus polymyxa TaxID=1406 RepID=UPI00129B5CF6|nr:terminase small subunit [Paenibacillus polymyxa]KAE8560238.1 terminase small subunit [Paenibacillus polymyxa]MCJ1218420.1 terminase small subunit [Paenibacillus polymyxa]